MSGQLICTECGAPLYRQWWSGSKGAYECRSCGADTPGRPGNTSAEPQSPPATQAFCPRCGAAHVGGMRFCGQCGHDFAGSPTAPPGAPSPFASPPPNAGGTRLGQSMSQGFGFGCGCLLLIVAIIAVLIVIGSLNGGGRNGNGDNGGGGGGVGNPAPQSPMTVQGSGISSTAPFRLNGGDYRVTWTATPDHDTGCYHGADLESTDVEIFEPLVNELLDSAAPKSGTTYVYGLAAGSYYVDASSGCQWSFTFTQQ